MLSNCKAFLSSSHSSTVKHIRRRQHTRLSLSNKRVWCWQTAFTLDFLTMDQADLTSRWMTSNSSIWSSLERMRSRISRRIHWMIRLTRSRSSRLNKQVMARNRTPWYLHDSVELMWKAHYYWRVGRSSGELSRDQGALIEAASTSQPWQRCNLWRSLTRLPSYLTRRHKYYHREATLSRP